MTRILKMAKYFIKDWMRVIFIYYGVMLLLFIFTIIAAGCNIDVTSSGLEISTIIVLFVIGLNSFKANFKLFMGNNISRKCFLKSLIVSIFPVACGMGIIDIILSRLFNLFVPSPMLYDMMVGKAENGEFAFSAHYQNGEAVRVWFQSNDFYTLLSTFVFLIAAYCLAFLAGLFITMLFYRSNTPVKLVIALIPVWMPIVLSGIGSVFPGVFVLLDGCSEIFRQVFLVNSWICSLGNLVLAAVAALLSFLLVRRAPVKN